MADVRGTLGQNVDGDLYLNGFLLENNAQVIGADAATTLTAAQLINTVVEGPVTAARTYTTDTAANIDAALPSPKVGDTFTTLVCNTAAGAFAITLAAGAGVTLKGSTTTIGQNKQAQLTWYRTGAAAWNCYVTVSA